MKCPFCNEEVHDNINYCIYCGNKVINIKEKHVPKCFDIFAILGFWIGIVTLSLSLFFGVGLFFADKGIVFSALGKKSIKHNKKANAGLVTSIISIVVNYILFSLSCIFFVLLLVYLILDGIK